ncbi:MAG: hypothetical protein QF632_01495 [Candidatus Woesearchaeota archaeon]|jgi:hypothetical protein|nr:hypothetical protein [Candidatus Woesearchaeota archaeon]MDP7323416.1 hypothetical protein [Candidatus Woesearchaeota archaeon]|tara:strand:- start:367 stop:1653 length:1287 start_codon:yes stop_codon:yes gene_type:complete
MEDIDETYLTALIDRLSEYKSELTSLFWHGDERKNFLDALIGQLHDFNIHAPVGLLYDPVKSKCQLLCERLRTVFTAWSSGDPEDMRSLKENDDFTIIDLHNEIEDIIGDLRTMVEDFPGTSTTSKVSYEDGFRVLGTFWFGKRSSASDFVYLYQKGESFEKRYASSILQSVVDMRSRGIAVSYRPKGKPYQYGYYARTDPNRRDAVGRAMAYCYGVMSTVNIHPFEFLASLLMNHDIANCNKGDAGNKSISIGSYIEVTPEVKAKVSELIRKGKEVLNTNKIAAVLTFGKSAKVSQPELAALCETPELISSVRWIGIFLADGLGYSVEKLTEKNGEPGIFSVRGDNHLHGDECEAFMSMVVDRFGQEYAHFHLLIDGVPEAEKRRRIVECYCNNELSQLTPDYRDCLEWITKIGTPEEIEIVRQVVT